MKSTDEKVKIFTRAAAGTMLVVLAYAGGQKLYEAVVQNEAEVKEAPYVVLKDGTIASPDMITTLNYDKNSFSEQVLMLFEGEEAPAYDDYLSHFTCNGCHKKCLLLTPSCANGRKKQANATEVYQEMYPDMDIEL